MTYSIVARDPVDGRFGVAIQSCWPFTGAGCPWLEVGVGAVVTQSYREIAHGPNGLARLRDGDAAPRALERVIADDDGREMRQVGIVDAAGRSASWTGSRCVEAAGHLTADGVAIQANMMERSTVWPAMLEAFQGAEGPLARRLLAALRAAEGEGGDIRGRQSAALVTSGAAGEPAWTREVDLRVDEHPAPLDELERLLRVQDAYDAIDTAEELAAAGNVPAALAAWATAGELAPDDAQVAVWRALAYAAGGRLGSARPLLERATRTNPRWPEFIERLVESEVQPELLDGGRALLAAWRT
jgi:uncharacterized Ntn-hydrolase superfamily protein